MSTNPTERQKFCRACEHPVSRHYKDVEHVVRCLVVERGTSSRGIIGLPYEKYCPCRNRRMPPKPKAMRTGTVYDDEMAILAEDAEKLRRAVKRATQRSKKR